MFTLRKGKTMSDNLKTVSEIKLIPYVNRDMLSSHPVQGRKTTSTCISAMKKSIIELGNFVEVNPIKVIYINGKYLIIDGQHRTEALIELGYDIPVQILPNDIDISRLMIALNSYNQPWKIPYYAKHFASMGVKIYRDFLDHMEKYEVTAGVMIAIYNKSSQRNQPVVQEYKEGKLRIVDDKHIEFTLLRLDSLRNLGKNPPLENSTRKKQQFQQAMLQAFENPEFNFEKFKKGLNKTKHDLNKLAKQKDLLEEIYKIESKGK